MSFDDEKTTFRVVINGEEQYSIWPLHRDVPGGWRDTGFSGRKAECLAHIETVWTDMRPLSLRQWIADRASAG
ncbi:MULTISPECIES: MbtH family protein [Rhodomicrobium]|uniref:MbtH family protein n=1 Tax=Rhodomicrobium TaxID=1068 RepID=UPI000B4AC78E|nr:MULTISPECIES: MbtH family protein [Rhodomicrobium]